MLSEWKIIESTPTTEIFEGLVLVYFGMKYGSSSINIVYGILSELKTFMKRGMLYLDSAFIIETFETSSFPS